MANVLPHRDVCQKTTERRNSLMRGRRKKVCQKAVDAKWRMLWAKEGIGCNLANNHGRSRFCDLCKVSIFAVPFPSH